MSVKPLILVLGATGMLGHRLANGLIELGYDVLAGLRARPADGSACAGMPVFRKPERWVLGLDAYDWISMKNRILELKPDVVINCIGVVKQKGEGKASVPCIAINALLPHVLDEAVSSYGGMLIHFSTDCVFKGDKGGYKETDSTDADDWYGRTKAMGEVAGSNALTIRTSIIGPEIAGFTSLISWFLANSGGRIKGYSRAIYSGLTTREVVNVVHHVLSDHPQLRGLYQVTSEPIDKYELLVRLNSALGLATHIDREEDFVLDRSMSSVAFGLETGYRAPSWESMISGLSLDIRNYWANDWIQAPSESSFVNVDSMHGEQA